MFSASGANRQLVLGGGVILLVTVLTVIAVSVLDDDSESPTTTLAPATTSVASTPSTSAPTESAVPRPPFDEDEAELMLSLLTLQALRGQPADAYSTVVTSGDQRFVSVLVELMRAMEIGLLPPDTYPAVVVGLQQLTGETFVDWPDWVGWYAETDLVPPQGFQAWKGQLFSAIDARFGDFFGDQPTTIRVEEVVWGGVAVDGIPALDLPRHIRPEQADYINASDLVFGVSLNKDHRAYPLRIMDSHEMANDVVGGIPVSLAYCTLCGAGVLYDGRLEGETYTFGSSGLLMRSNKLMYDRNTNTLWNQLTGRPVQGSLAGREIELTRLPVVVTTWGEWLTAHPDTKVLDIDTGFNRDYDPGAAYGDYYAAPDTMFPVGQRSDLLRPKDRVFAMLVEDVPVAYPIGVLTEEGVVNDTVAKTAVVLVAPRGDLQGSGTDFVSGLTVEWQAGAEVRAFDAGSHTFGPGVDPDSVVDEFGTVWQVTEEGLVAGDEVLARLPGHLSYWFGWFSYFPRTLVYGLEG